MDDETVIHTLETFTLPEGSIIQSDSMVVIGSTQKHMENVLRLVETTDTEGNPIRIITNRFDLDAEEIGEIYRSRWAIETFFKWMKQHAKITVLYGTSEQAVENQMYLALNFQIPIAMKCVPHLIITLNFKSKEMGLKREGNRGRFRWYSFITRLID